MQTGTLVAPRYEDKQVPQGDGQSSRIESTVVGAAIVPDGAGRSAAQIYFNQADADFDLNSIPFGTQRWTKVTFDVEAGRGVNVRLAQ
jgi:hypothetical protein